jgi:hypothetical protein
MNNEEDAKFYRDQVFQIIQQQLIDLNKQIGSLRNDISQGFKEQNMKINSIDKQVTRIFAWASGLGAAAGLVITLIKEKIFKI